MVFWVLPAIRHQAPAVIPPIHGRQGPYLQRGPPYQDCSLNFEVFWAPTLTANDNKDDLTTSICEAALTRFSDSDDSLAEMIEQYSITVRDFMLLSLLCDQESFDVDQLERALGLDNESISQCIGRLDTAGLVKHNGFDSGIGQLDDVRTTVAGRILAQRILDGIS